MGQRQRRSCLYPLRGRKTNPSVTVRGQHRGGFTPSVYPRAARATTETRAICGRFLAFAVAIFAIALAPSASASSVPTGFISITGADRIALMNTLDPGLARAYFDTNNSYGFIVYRAPMSLKAALQLKVQGWRFRLGKVYYNFLDFQADVAAHALETEDDPKSVL